MKEIFIDINTDAGEGMGNEARLFPYISSCNIACGGHTGTAESIRKTANLGIASGVLPGAHPSYPDTVHFGRISMQLPPEDLTLEIKKQVAFFEETLNHEGITMHHIKAHGALYNDMAHKQELVLSYLDALIPYKDRVFLYVACASQLGKVAKSKGFRIRWEAFLDRNYNNDLTLVSRKNSNAMIESPKKVLQHLLRMVKTGQVLSVVGKKRPIHADTYCLHSDSANAIEIIEYLTKELPKHQIQIAKY